jgi:thioesterase-3
MKNMLEVTVRSTHLDVMGHVNNAKYVEYLEWGRCDELEKHGVNLWEMVKEGVGFAVVNLNVNFRREAFVGEVLVVDSKFTRIRNNKIGTIEQSIRRRSNGEVVCDAEVTFLAFDLNAHKSIAMPDGIRRLMSDPA